MSENNQISLEFFQKRFGKDIYEFSYVGDIFILRRKRNNKLELCMVAENLSNCSPWF